MGRKQDFKDAIKKFCESDKDKTKDYMDFVIASSRALSQGVAISWQEIESIINKQLGIDPLGLISATEVTASKTITIQCDDEKILAVGEGLLRETIMSSFGDNHSYSRMNLLVEVKPLHDKVQISITGNEKEFNVDENTIKFFLRQVLAEFL